MDAMEGPCNIVLLWTPQRTALTRRHVHLINGKCMNNFQQLDNMWMFLIRGICEFHSILNSPCISVLIPAFCCLALKSETRAYINISHFLKKEGAHKNAKEEAVALQPKGERIFPQRVICCLHHQTFIMMPDAWKLLQGEFASLPSYWLGANLHRL